MVEVIERKLHLPRPFVRTINVGAADLVVAPANPKRRGLIFSSINTTSTIFLSPNQPATLNSGMALLPGQPRLDLDTGGWGLLATAEWHAIAGLAQTPPGTPLPFSNVVQSGSTGAVGIVQTYNVFGGSTGALTAATFGNPSAAGATVQLRLIRGGTTIVLATATTPLVFTGPVYLNIGDVVQWYCSVLSAGTTADFSITGYTQTGVGSLPSSTPLGVIELEG